MNGFWMIPFFGIIFMVIMFLIASRFFGREDFCGKPPSDNDRELDELKKEIQALRDGSKNSRTKSPNEAKRNGIGHLRH